MTIHFHPSFDSSHFVNFSHTNALFNEKILGFEGLIHEILLRIGKPVSKPNTIKRQLEFHRIVSEFVSDPQNQEKAFFFESFQTDQLGTSKHLLVMRDELVFIGWNESFSNVSARLDSLAALETKVKQNPLFAHEANLPRLLNELKNGNAMNPGISKIIVYTDIKFLPQLSIQILDELKNHYGVEIFTKNEVDWFSNDADFNSIADGLKIFRFNNTIDMARFLAVSGLWDDQSLLIAEDTAIFSSFMSRFAHPAPESHSNGTYTSISQMMLLAASLFGPKLNVRNYIEYLSLPFHPVDLALRMRVKDHYKVKSGFGEDTIQTLINEYIAELRERLENRPTDDELHRKSSLYALFLLPYRDFKELDNFYSEMANWANRRAHVADDSIQSDERKMELLNLKSLCNSLVAALNQNKIDNSNELQKLISGLYTARNLTLTAAEKGAMNTISAPASALHAPQKLFWAEFNRGERIAVIGDFLNQSEILKLKEKNCEVWDGVNQMKIEFNAAFRLLSETNCKYLLLSKNFVGVDNFENPLFSFLKMKIKNLSITDIDLHNEQQMNKFGIKGKSIDRIVLNRPELYYSLNSTGNITLREEESFTSLDKLINFPMDWFFEYVLKFRDDRAMDFTQINTVSGTCAHAFIERILSENQFDLDKIRTDFQQNFELRFEKSVQESGLLLYLDEFQIDYFRLKDHLKISFERLLHVLKSNNLKVLAVEKKIEKVNLSESELMGKIGGSIDLIVKNLKNELIIIDFKYSIRSKKYEKLLSEGKSIQAGVYFRLVQAEYKRAPIGFAYFMLKTGDCFSTISMEGATHIPEATALDVLYEKVINSVKYRLKELNSMNESELMEIEMAEEISIKDNPLRYSQDEVHRNLIPLNLESNKKKKNYYGSIKLFKGQLN